MPLHNLATCSGWATDSMGYIAAGGCMKSRLGLVLLFFIIALIRKWGSEEVGLDFNFLLALVGGLGSYFMIVTILGSFKIAMVVGLICALVLGYGGGLLFGGSESEYE